MVPLVKAMEPSPDQFPARLANRAAALAASGAPHARPTRASRTGSDAFRISATAGMRSFFMGPRRQGRDSLGLAEPIDADAGTAGSETTHSGAGVDASLTRRSSADCGVVALRRGLFHFS